MSLYSRVWLHAAVPEWASYSPTAPSRMQVKLRYAIHPEFQEQLKTQDVVLRHSTNCNASPVSIGAWPLLAPEPGARLRYHAMAQNSPVRTTVQRFFSNELGVPELSPSEWASGASVGEIEIVCATKGQQDFTLVVTVSADDVRKVNAVHVPPCHARHGAVPSRSIIVRRLGRVDSAMLPLLAQTPFQINFIDDGTCYDWYVTANPTSSTPPSLPSAGLGENQQTSSSTSGSQIVVTPDQPVRCF